jgi:rRNA maturation protein Nop10
MPNIGARILARMNIKGQRYRLGVNPCQWTTRRTGTPMPIKFTPKDVVKYRGLHWQRFTPVSFTYQCHRNK